MKELEILEQLTNMFGPSGNEEEVELFLKEEYRKLNLKILKDPYGNIYGLKKSKNKNAKKVLVIGHMDEVGFMVRKILPNGSVMVNPLGRFNSETILSNRAILKNGEGKKFYGSVCALPPHLLKNNSSNEKTPISNMIFDFGFINSDDALNNGIQIGDSIILEGDFSLINNDKRILAKAIDDRYGLATSLIAMNDLINEELDYDLYIGGVCQEEVGLRGSLCASNFIKPDFAIILDVSAAYDTDGNTTEFGKLGKGVLIRVLDANMIARKDIIKFQKNCLDNANVPYQYFISPGGTDAGSVHKSLSGIPTMTYCLVARNIHSCSSIMDTNDYLNSIKGLEEILKSLNDNIISNFNYLDSAIDK